ncbi:Hypothetical protein HVR_LOCUS424 [uncultured virus]|nr:Hypothetical protein HVR_LOCUS424 [uncultured virus]
MPGLLQISFLDENCVQNEFKETVTNEFFFGFDQMVRNLVITEDGEFWGNIVSYDYDPKIFDAEYLDRLKYLRCLVLINAVNQEKFSSISEVSNSESLHIFMNEIYPNKKGLLKTFNQNLFYLTLIQTNGDEKFLLLTYPSEEFLQGINKAIKLHKFHKITSSGIIDTSNYKSWKHLPFPF